MARKIRPLTNTEIKQAKPRDKVWYLFDGDGLQLAIKPIGSKLWQFKYNSPTLNKRRNISFGSYEDVTLAQAREKRRECRSLIADGIDPIEHFKYLSEKDRAKSVNTIGKLAHDWLAIKSTYVGSVTIYKYQHNFKNHILPNFQDLTLDQITPTLVLDRLDYLRKANKTHTLKINVKILAHILRYAVSLGLIKYSPIETIHLTLPKHKTKHLKAVEVQDLPKLINAMQTNNIREVTRLLFKFQLLTMVRPSEARLMTWDEVDLDNKVWTIPADRMKMRLEHTVQLSEQAVSILKQAKQLCGGDDFVFKNLWRGRYKPLTASTLIVCLQSCCVPRITAHGLRTVASTVLNEHEFNPDIIESMLAHSGGGVRSIYNRSRHEERKRELYQWWADYCVSIGLEI